MDLLRHWEDYTFVAWDIETSGSHPLSSEIIEIGAVRWSKGKIVDEFVSFFRPHHPIPPQVQLIHGISDEMVSSAPLLSDHLEEILFFFKGSVLLAHHAPFDMGFLTIELERNKLPLPTEPVLCTSLLSRKWIPESKDHKLQTLIEYLALSRGSAHRALDDAKACMELALKCFERIPSDQSNILSIAKSMGKPIAWNRYQIYRSNIQVFLDIATAIEQHKDLEIIYNGGSKKKEPRRVTPKGCVRNPDGDYMVAFCSLDQKVKRFYIQRIMDWSVIC